VERLKAIPGQVKAYVADMADEASWGKIDDFILDWFDTITPEQLRDYLARGEGSIAELLPDEVKADIWARVPFLADNAIYRAATEVRVRYYITERLPYKVVVEHPELLPYWEAMKPHHERAVKMVRAALKELFD
jgi:hypothetical protein